jgi:hypothetical protein
MILGRVGNTHRRGFGQAPVLSHTLARPTGCPVAPPKINRKDAKSAKVREGDPPRRPVPSRVFAGLAFAYLRVLRAFAVDLSIFPQAIRLKDEPGHHGGHTTASGIRANAIGLTVRRFPFSAPGSAGILGA